MKPLFALFLAAGLLSLAPSAIATEQEGWIRHTTSITYSKLVKRLNAAVKSEKMLLVTRASASSVAARPVTAPRRTKRSKLATPL